MNDLAPDFRALPILDADRAEYHQAVPSYRYHIINDLKHRARLWMWLAISCWVIAAALAVALAFLLPFKQAVPLFLVIREDGTVDTSVALADLGADQAQKVVRAAIWRYVQEREAYSWSEAKHRYDLISLMSAEPVQHDYQQWFTKSKDAPQQAIGKKGQISVQEISISFVRDGVALVRFWKTKQMYGEKEIKTTAVATVEFELLNNAPASLILEDPAGLHVVRYQVEENSP